MRRFLFDLAVAMGEPNVDKMAHGLSPGQVIEWMAYNRLSPITKRRDDYHAAMIQRTMANIWRGKSQPAYELGDFMPQWGVKRQKSPSELYQLIRAGIALSYGLEDRRGV